LFSRYPASIQQVRSQRRFLRITNGTNDVRKGWEIEFSLITFIALVIPGREYDRIQQGTAPLREDLRHLAVGTMGDNFGEPELSFRNCTLGLVGWK
jgi:hypothetical protein